MPVIRKSPPGTTPQIERLVRGLVDELTTETKDGPEILEEEQADGSWRVRVIWDEWESVDDRSWVIMQAYKLKRPDLYPLMMGMHGFTRREAELLGFLPSGQDPAGPTGLGAVVAKIASALRTDDNAATADPLFCVFQKLRVYGLSSGYTDDFVWVNEEGEADSDESEHLGKIDKEVAEALGWRRVGYKEVDAFVTACLTRGAPMRTSPETGTT